MTLIEEARAGKITDIMKKAAKNENVQGEFIRQGIANGSICIPISKINRKRKKIIGIGQGLSTKVNVNIGGSPDITDIKMERKKLEAAIEYKTDAIMDLSVGVNAEKIRNMVFKESPISVGTVPLYEVMSRVKGNVINITPDYIFDVIESQAKLGVDFITVHCGVTRRIVEKIKKDPRVSGIVSRGGAIIAEWILKNNKENPLYTHYDRLLELSKKYDLTLSLGDGMRPGCIDDSTDWAQIAELKILGKLAKRAWEKGVQVMIEGPGHIPLHEVRKNIKLQKKYCYNAPFYVLGPLVTDIAPGYDHITSAIGGAIAAEAGADFLCYVTPAEHLHLPDVDDVIDGLIGARIAAHAADIAKGIPKAREWDSKMAKARKSLDWKAQEKISINPKLFHKRMKDKLIKKKEPCTMCGEFCSMKRMNDCL
ncbi:MAG: phosphomethylpyrimidine synthase ThiC [Elusimicrobiota bacterium]